MKAWQFLINLNKVCFFMSRERTGKASNSELKRWFKNKAVIVNGAPIKFDDDLPEIKSFVLFTKSKKVTLF